MSEYVITSRIDATDEPFLSAVVEDVNGGKMVKAIIQNKNISEVLEVEAIKEFLAAINGTTVDKLPAIDEFLAKSVHILPAQNTIGDDFIKELG